MTHRFTNHEIAARQQAIKGIVIEHADFLVVEDELELRALAGTGGEWAQVTMLVAPSGCGKTTTVKQAAQRLQARPGISHNSLLPIVYCKLPPSCSIKTMTTALLLALNDPLAEKHGGTATDATYRITGLLKAQNVRLLILDEVQQLYRQSMSVDTLALLCDWLKCVLDDAGVPVICVGLPEMLSIISKHLQLARRTADSVLMRPFFWSDTNENLCAPFRSILHVFEKELDFPYPSGLGEFQFAERMHVASGGLIGIVAQLVWSAIAKSMRRSDGPDSLTLADFAKAYQGLPFQGANPFEERVNLSDIRAFQASHPLEIDRVMAGDSKIAVRQNAGPRTSR